MPFAYYDHLPPEGRAVYRASDAVTSLRLAGATALTPVVSALEACLARDDRNAVEDSASSLVTALCAAFRVPSPRVKVLASRPRLTGGELHGLYTFQTRRRPVIRVWMRTARHGRVVAFRTFLRTVLHEVLHHLDFHLLRLPASFHTEGFYKRESSLFHQLVPGARHARGPGGSRGGPARHH